MGLEAHASEGPFSWEDDKGTRTGFLKAAHTHTHTLSPNADMVPEDKKSVVWEERAV